MTYSAFLESKKLVVPSSGIRVDPSNLHAALFPFQRDLVAWALRKGRSALFCDTGTGKTIMQLAWAQHAGERVLVLAPLGVARQTVREGQRWDVPVTYQRSDASIADGITITNYEMLPHFDPAKFDAVVLDECFAKGTPVRTGSGWKHIEDVRIGEIILNAAGWDIVSDVHRREVPYAIRIASAGRAVISSPNHPYFTQRGWVAAQDLCPGDHLMETATAVRMVWDRVQAALRPDDEESVLRAILLSEMADASAGVSGEGSQSGSSQEARGGAATLVEVRRSKSTSRNRTHKNAQSVVASRSAGEDIPPIERDAPRTFRAWRKWSRNDATSGTIAGGSGAGMDTGVHFVTGPTDSRLSDALQDRLGAWRAENRYRSGWVLAREQAAPGSEEGCEVGFARVDSLEVLEPGHPDLDRLRDADGKFYFYDLGGTRHPSFAVRLGAHQTGVLVHNSSILKNFEGKTRSALIQAFRQTPMRLCCTATPAPNDIAELANHAEFLGIMSRVEMLASFFVHDDEGWRLKGHARDPFYRWLASWGMSLKRPSDLGYSDLGYDLPGLSIIPEIVDTDYAPPGQLFATTLKGVGDRAHVRKATLEDRVQRAAQLIHAEPDEPWIAWVGLNEEGRRLHALIPGSSLVEGNQSPEQKADALEAFATGKVRVMISKCSIAGMGLNFQHCARMAFVGLSDSYEAYYQAIRRCYRFGQEREVRAHIVLTEPEEAIYANVLRKEREAEQTASELLQHVAAYEREEIGHVDDKDFIYESSEASGQNWRMLLGDSAERMKELPSDSMDLSIYSPPFGALYVYSNSERDLGNSRTEDEFWEHFGYISQELMRVMKPGRIMAVHCAQIPSQKARDGVIGLKDFRGDVIRHFQAYDFIYHGEVCIDKDPQAQAIRTKSKGLLFTQMHKDASWSRPALADYIVLFRKPGDNAVPIHPDINNDEWIEWARPIWYNIRESRTLNASTAREANDERHICPLQLETIERCIKLWSNQTEMVFDPFGGIASTGFEALRLNRKFTGIELKPSYWKVGVTNLRQAEAMMRAETLFSGLSASDLGSLVL